MKASRYLSSRGGAVLLLLCLLFFALAFRVSGQSDGYDLNWHVISGGGFLWSHGNSYALGGTVAQPEAGLVSGGSYSLRVGFWVSSDSRVYVYLPLLMRSSR